MLCARNSSTPLAHAHGQPRMPEYELIHRDDVQATRAHASFTRPVVAAIPPDGGARRKPPVPGSVLPRPVNMGTYGTYHLQFQLWRPQAWNRRANFTDWTPGQMMTQLNSNFSHYFTFTGCGRHLRVGARCRLKTTVGLGAPVQVVAVAPDGFALRSLPGHPEGGGRMIRFQFQRFTNAAEISSMTLVVDGWGPLSWGSLLGPLNSSTVARTAWNTFQNNIRTRFPDRPPGDKNQV